MKKVGALILAACVMVGVVTPATACTAAAARLNAADREKARLDWRKIRGTYHVVSVERQEAEDYDGPHVVSTYNGIITSRDGKRYSTQHLDNGYIVLCEMTSQPMGDADGSFYVSRRKIHGTDSYELRDWDGDYLPADGEEAAE